MSFKIRYLALAVATATPVVSNAAGLDRSTQPSWGFTQDGTFAYVEHIVIDPKVGGKDSKGNKVPEMADDYHFLNFGAKADINSRVSIGAFFDQPWGADVNYKGTNNFVNPATDVANQVINLANIQGVDTLDKAKSFISTKDQEIIAGKNQYAAGQAQLAAGQAQLAQGKADYAAGLAQYEAGQAKLAQGQQAYDQGAATLAQKQAQYQQGLAQYQAGTAQYQAGLAQYNAGLTQYTTAKQQYDAGVAALTQLQNAGLGNSPTAQAIQARLAAAQPQLTAAETQLAASQQRLATANAQLTAAKAQLDAAPAQLQAGQAQLQAAAQQLAEGKEQLAAAQAKLAAGKDAITTNEAKLAQGTAELEAAKVKIAEGEATLAKFKALAANAEKVTLDRSATKVRLESQNFTGLLGVKFGDKNQFQVYGGPALQKLEGDVHLRGNAYSYATGYDAYLPSNTAYGWMAGVAYSKPEIALKAALTYRSEIEHDATMSETMPLAPLLSQGALAADMTDKIKIKTPQSVNLDFQTGLNPTTLLTAKLRWVPWSDFSLTPKLYNSFSKIRIPQGINLVDYSKDGWTAELGLGKKLSPKWAVSGAVGWDSGAGNPVTSLGPVEGNWNVGLGARYNITPEWAVSAGAKYLMFGDAKGQLPDHKTIVGDFQNNDGMVYGLRLTYQKK